MINTIQKKTRKPNNQRTKLYKQHYKQTQTVKTIATIQHVTKQQQQQHKNTKKPVNQYNTISKQ